MTITQHSTMEKEKISNNCGWVYIKRHTDDLNYVDPAAELTHLA
jgi:hypothetical protein